MIELSQKYFMHFCFIYIHIFRSHLERSYFPPRFDNSCLVLYQTASNCPGEKLAAPGVSGAISYLESLLCVSKDCS